MSPRFVTPFLLRSLESLMGSYYWQKYQYEGEQVRPWVRLSGAADGLFTWHNHPTAFERARLLASTDEIISSL